MHTEGKLRQDANLISDENGFFIASTYGEGIAKDKENARRLVACWNACDGLPTDILESMVNPAATYTALMKERGELVKLLRDYMNKAPGSMAKAAYILAKYPEAPNA